MGVVQDWWDRIWGRPNLANYARDVAERLERHGVGSLSYFAEQQELRVKGGNTVYFLGNGFSDYRRATKAKRRAVMERFVNGLANGAAASPLPANYQDARPRLLPIVRGADEDTLGFLHAQRIRTSGTPPRKTPHANRPLVAGLTKGVAYDAPNSLMRLTMEQLGAWKVDLDQALADALENLRALPEHGGWVQRHHGVWSGRWGDDYEPSRLLLPDLIHRLGVADPVAIAPLRNMLLVTSARNEAGLIEMARLAQEAMQAQPRWLSGQPMRLRDDGRWEVFEPPASSAQAFRELYLTERADAYAGQKTSLEKIHEHDGVDLFVASVILFRERDAGRLRSCTTWSRDVDTLLPQTELIAFHRAEGEMLLVPWDPAVEVVSGLMEAIDLAPVRYRVRAFPDEGQWDLLKQRATA